jgi:DNA-binding PucR family transcriptional regulator
MLETDMFSGVSRHFFNLLDVRKHYEESLKAIKSGKHLKDDQVLFFYEDYILQHMFNLCTSQQDLKEMCHHSIFTLIKYDNDNSTSYVKNLYSYIMTFKSPSELATLLHVHRNTMYYRINKIENIMNINLSNIDNYFSIYLSFKILEYLGEDFS